MQFQVSGTTYVIVSKVDILQKLNLFKLYEENVLHTFNTYEQMKTHITFVITSKCPLVQDIMFSSSPYHI